MVWNSVSSVLNTEQIGAGWEPKRNNIRVGRDVAPLTATAFSGETSRNKVLAQGDEVTFKSKGLFNMAKLVTQGGHSVHSFRSLSRLLEEPQNSSDIMAIASKNTDGAVYQQGDYRISFHPMDNSSQLRISRKNAETGEFELITSLSGKEDIKISWDDKGEPRILTGAAALTDGALQADGDNDIIFRRSDADMVAGNGTIVLNDSSYAGNFSGGKNVTYLGSYQGGTFTESGDGVNFAGYFSNASFSGLSGQSVFSGVFEGASIDAQESNGVFSGYFSATDVTGGKNSITANGLFMDASTIQGSEENDSFSGRFISSEINGAGGDDTFGSAPSVSNMETIYRNGKVSRMIVADFVKSTVNADAGNDRFNGVMWGGSFNADEGENVIKGIFGKATVNGGDGDDRISAVYSYASEFNTGLGDDKISLTTAEQSTVNADEGKNSIAMGQNNPGDRDATWQISGDYFSKERPAETGELQFNTVNVEKGDNIVAIHNGESSSTVLTGEAEEESEKEENAPVDDSALAADEQGDSLVGNEILGALSSAPEVIKGGGAATDAEELRADAEEAGTASNTASGYDRTGRYMRAYGFEPATPGQQAVTVNAAHGESRTFYGVERHNVFEDDKEKLDMTPITVRAGESGTYSWQRWKKLHG